MHRTVGTKEELITANPRQAGPVGQSAQFRAHGVSARAWEQRGDHLTDYRVPAHVGGEHVLRRAQCPNSVVTAASQGGERETVAAPDLGLAHREGVTLGVHVLGDAHRTVRPVGFERDRHPVQPHVG